MGRRHRGSGREKEDSEACRALPGDCGAGGWRDQKFLGTQKCWVGEGREEAKAMEGAATGKGKRDRPGERGQGRRNGKKLL